MIIFLNCACFTRNEKHTFAESGDLSEGKVIINKLHRFLRQRSVPATSSLSPASPCSPVSEGGQHQHLLAASTNNNIAHSRTSLKTVDTGPQQEDAITHLNENKVGCAYYYLKLLSFHVTFLVTTTSANLIFRHHLNRIQDVVFPKILINILYKNTFCLYYLHSSPKKRVFSFSIILYSFTPRTAICFCRCVRLLHPALFPALPAGLHGLGAGDRAGPRHARLARGRAAAAGECGGGAPSCTVVQLDTSATFLFIALCSLP